MLRYEQPYMVNQVILQQGMLGLPRCPMTLSDVRIVLAGQGTHFVVLVHGIVEIEANGMVVATVMLGSIAS